MFRGISTVEGRKRYEYEFRLVVLYPSSQILDEIENRFSKLRPIHRYDVVYAKPHFRFKNRVWEIKTNLSSVAVYHAGLWFKLVESEEIPFSRWTRKMYSEFLDVSGFYQNPFVVEHRWQIDISERAKLYGFRKDRTCGLVFELEIGTFRERSHLKSADVTMLDAFGEEFFEPFRKGGYSPRYLLTPCNRKPVIPVHEPPSGLLVARKYDGTFGIVYSYADRIYETWEGNERRVLPGETLGDGLVFGAERIVSPSSTVVILLDVYQVRGSPTLGNEKILTEFLPSLKLPKGYEIQRYHLDIRDISPSRFGSDGYIYHDCTNDVIYKLKEIDSIDLVHIGGYFLFPDRTRRMAPITGLEEGSVYECTPDLVPIRKRNDRLTGNTKQQLQRLNELRRLRELRNVLGGDGNGRRS